MLHTRSRRLLDGRRVIGVGQLRPDSRPIVRSQIPTGDSATGSALDGGAAFDGDAPPLLPLPNRRRFYATQPCYGRDSAKRIDNFSDCPVHAKQLRPA